MRPVSVIAIAVAAVASGCSSLPLQPANETSAFAERAGALTRSLKLAPANAEAFAQRCDEAYRSVVGMRDELAARKGRAGRGDLADYDAMRQVLLGVGFGEASIMAEAHPDPALREAGDACQQKMSDLQASISLSRPVFDRLHSIDPSALSSRDAFLLEQVLEDFRRSGVDKDAATRARIEALNTELTELSLQWGKALREARQTMMVEPAALAGLPADYIAARKPDAQGKVEISTAYPDVYPILNYAHSDTLRRDVLQMFRNRGYPDSVPTLRALLEKRHEFAGLLGYENWAEYALANKMAGDPAQAQAFLDRLARAARPAAEVEYGELLATLRQIRPKADAVPEWSSSYLQERLRRTSYALDSQEVRQYFAYDNVRDGIITLIQDLFAVEIRPWEDAPLWHDSVTAHALYQDGELIGRFYLDMHPRDGKYSHAAAFPIRLGPTSQGVPIAALMCNFPAGGHDTGLMEHGQVETFLHEFGHLIHMLFSAQPDFQELAMHELEWDFVEAPSQMLEEWVWDYDTLAKFARNKQGQVIPRPLVDKMIAARNVGLGMGTMRQLTYANVSLNYYNRPPEQVDFKAMWDEMEQRFGLLARLPEVHQYANFGHLDGYSAFYYTYQWSLAIATDLFSRFEANGLRDAETAQRYREAVLAPGASQPAAELVREFLGREWSVDAYEQQLNEASQPKPVL